MNLTSNMVDRLHQIRRIEQGVPSCELDAPAEQLGAELVALYYRTDKSRTRVLITQFLADAGGDWLHKLVTAEVQQQSMTAYPASQPGLKTASLQDYLSVLAANDDFEQSVQQFDIAG